ncbi:MAG: uracil-DNA glycosylase family protein [candidate division WOR-3 bacterium]
MDLKTYNDLHNSVMNCQNDQCPRFKHFKPFLFKRLERSLDCVSVLFLSEEIPPNYHSLSYDEIFQHLTKKAIAQKGKVTKDICRMIGRPFNPTEDKFVYWTMAVKCIPYERKYFKYHTCDRYCVDYLKNEIMLLPKLEYIVVYGKHALKTLRRINDYLPQNLRKANIYTIANSMPEEGFNMHFDNRNFKVIVLFHPSYSNIHYEKPTNFKARRLKEMYEVIISSKVSSQS